MPLIATQHEHAAKPPVKPCPACGRKVHLPCAYCAHTAMVKRPRARTSTDAEYTKRIAAGWRRDYNRMVADGDLHVRQGVGR